MCKIPYFIVGEPLSRTDRDANRDAMIEARIEYLKAASAGGEDADLRRHAKELVLERKEHTIDRITDKSVGMLQVLALLLAGLSFHPPANSILSSTIFWMLGIGSLLLLSNMVLLTRRNPQDQQIDADLADASFICAMRGVLLMLTIAIMFVAIPLWVLSVGLRL